MSPLMQFMFSNVHEIINPKSIATIQHDTFPTNKCIKDGGDCGVGGYCVKCVFEIDEPE